MRPKIAYRFTRHTLTALLKRPGTKLLIGLLNLLVLAALLSSYGNVREQRTTIGDYQSEVRERWESNPDKHPHRMAHYGYVVFRDPHPLSFFDRGLENYLGNAIFLEAHRQNTANYATASQSTGLLRFGELSGAMVLQALLPLLLFFWGFASVAGEREDGKLKLVFAQGARWSELVLGRAVGLFCAAGTVWLPAFVLTGVLGAFLLSSAEWGGTLLRYGLLLLTYGLYLFVLSLFTVWMSAVSKTAKTALLRLIGCWLLFVLVIPKVAQVVGEVLYPTPSKMSFDRAVEADLLEQGDSHNPDDPYFTGLRDSLLAEYGVKTTKELPFNYGGFIMREGEKLSTVTFRKHEARLMTRFGRQQAIVRWTSLFDPYVAIKYLSMTLAGTDYYAYRNFRDQAEAYRYDLAQTMNELQMKLIGNDIASSADKRAALSRQYWIDFEDFQQRPVALGESLAAEWLPLAILLGWLTVLTGLALFLRHPVSIL